MWLGVWSVHRVLNQGHARAQVNLVLVLVLEALHVSDRLAARGQPLPLLPPPPASLNYACACLLPLVFLRRPPRRCRPHPPQDGRDKGS